MLQALRGARVSVSKLTILRPGAHDVTAWSLFLFAFLCDRPVLNQVACTSRIILVTDRVLHQYVLSKRPERRQEQ